MTPAARLAAAIGVLDRWLGGAPAEQALTNWARASRYAGSGDRHAVRDLVFDAIRCRRSFASLGGIETGRALILGGLRASGQDPAALFTGEGHAPAPLDAGEAGTEPKGLVALDCPDWLAPSLRESLGDDFAPVMAALRHRAPVFLRVNTARMSVKDAMNALAEESIPTLRSTLSATALEVTGNARTIQSSQSYLAGMVELQDAASQRLVEELPLTAGQRVLDYCAGGGGKTLAMAGRAPLDLTAHDVAPQRLRDLPARAARAGVTVRIGAPQGLYDGVLVDAPCSGSGAWRRSPEGKWSLTPDRLAALVNMQQAVLDEAAAHVAPGGWLAYATCSLLQSENSMQAAAFNARHPGFSHGPDLRLTPLDGGDGFFMALFARAT